MGVVGTWPFAGWTPARLLPFMLQTPHDVCPLTGRVTLRPSVIWATPAEREVLADTPTGAPWPLGVAVLWHRVWSRMERAQCPQPWHVLAADDEEYGASRLWALMQVGAIARLSGRTGVVHA